MLRFVNNSRHARRLSRLIKPQTNGTTGPPSVYDNSSRFPGKSIALQHVFFYLAQWSSIQDGNVIWAKTPKAKAKAKPAPKRLKAENVPLKNKTAEMSSLG